MTSVEDMVRACLERNYARFFGFELVEAQEGAVTLALPHRADFEHAPGCFQGSVVNAIAECASAYSTFTLAQRDWVHVTLDQSIQFVGPARGDRLIAQARVVRKGRSVSFAGADIFVEESGEQRLCARQTLTQFHRAPR